MTFLMSFSFIYETTKYFLSKDHSGFFSKIFFLLTLSERYEFYGGHYQIFAEHL